VQATCPEDGEWKASEVGIKLLQGNNFVVKKKAVCWVAQRSGG